jgi:hypothetical protein
VLLNVNWEAVLQNIGQKLGNITQYIIDAAKEIDWVAIGKALLKGAEVIDKMTSDDIHTRSKRGPRTISSRLGNICQPT